MNSALKEYSLSVLPPTSMCKHNGARSFLPVKLLSVWSWVREFVQRNSCVTLLTLTLHWQDPEHPEWPEHWSSGQAVWRQMWQWLYCVWKAAASWVKHQPFSLLSRESRHLIFFLWVNRNGSLIRRHNGWTWELFKFCFLQWGKEFVLVSELLLEMRVRKAKLGPVTVRLHSPWQHLFLNRPSKHESS